MAKPHIQIEFGIVKFFELSSLNHSAQEGASGAEKPIREG
jgi:hypothetical protein